jgi:carbon starvation protein
MLFVTTTTMTAGVQMAQQFMADISHGNPVRGGLNLGLTLFVMVSVGMIVLLAISRWFAVLTGMIETHPNAGERGASAP